MTERKAKLIAIAGVIILTAIAMLIAWLKRR